MPPMPSTKYGTSFAMRISRMLTRVTISASIVPRSHSRAMTIAVKQRAGQRHDDRDQARHQIIAAADRRVEPYPRLHRDRHRRGQSPRLGPRRKPTRPDLLQIAFDDARVVGVDTVDDDPDRRPAGLQSPGEIGAQPDDALHLARRHRPVGLLDRGKLLRPEIGRLRKPRGEARGVGARLLDDESNRHVAWRRATRRSRRSRAARPATGMRWRCSKDRGRSAETPCAAARAAGQAIQFCAAVPPFRLYVAVRSFGSCGHRLPRILFDQTDEGVFHRRFGMRPASWKCALMLSEVPSARMRPCAMITRRSQYSASSMKWVVTRIVTPGFGEHC